MAMVRSVTAASTLAGSGGSAGVDGHAVGAAHHLGGELLLEGRHLRPLDHHAAGQDGVDRGPLLGAYQRPGRGNELQ